MGGNDASSQKGSSPEEEEEEEETGGGGISEYEKQRLLRIQENRARLEALGLPRLASSLLGSLQKQQSAASKGKRKATTTKKEKGDAVDDEYRPSEEEEQEGESSSPSEEDEEDYKPSYRSNRKGKKKIVTEAKVRKTSCGREKMEGVNVIDDDVALQKAISLSLGQKTDELGPVLGQFPQDPGTNNADATSLRKKDKANTKETARGRNIRKGNKSRVQLTDDEVAAYFFTFDGAGKGQIALRDLERMVAAHDFTWTDSEMANMIHFFDSDGDGKLNLSDFRKIVSRCNLLQDPKEC